MQVRSSANSRAKGAAGDRRYGQRLPSELTMERETRVSYGPVPHSLTGEPLREMHSQMIDGTFLLRAEGHHYFFYRPGGVTIERGTDADVSEEALWLDGSVYAAVASLNGLLPIHASAVAHDDHVYAFTGPAGSGKSTLVAALAGHRLPMFCDDTLILDLSEPDRVLCLPGHKRLKLCPDAFQLTAAGREEKVSRAYDKYYAKPSAAWTGGALPLAELIFLEEGAMPAIEQIVGAERFTRLEDEHQTARLFEEARRFDRAGLFEHRARLASQIAMTRLLRPLERQHFAQSIELAAQHVRGQ
jgi:hypothetical protein